MTPKPKTTDVTPAVDAPPTVGKRQTGDLAGLVPDRRPGRVEVTPESARGEIPGQLRIDDA